MPARNPRNTGLGTLVGLAVSEGTKANIQKESGGCMVVAARVQHLLSLAAQYQEIGVKHPGLTRACIAAAQYHLRKGGECQALRLAKMAYVQSRNAS